VRGRRLVGVFVALGVVASGIAVVRSVRQDDPVPLAVVPVTSAPDAATAFRAASLQRTRVEIADLRGAERTLFAEPDGSLTAEVSPGPVRVRQGGAWVPTDTMLVRRRDGSIGPRAAAIPLAFSPGGTTAPMVSLGGSGARLALSWPGRLPSPTLDGDTATYREVLPGADLVLRALPEGYTQQLVIRTRQAAADPALAAIRLGVRTDLRLRATRGGGVEAVDRAGKAVLTAPPSPMWDSAATPRTATARVDLTPGALTIRPDRALLDNPATRYPVTVDPDWNSPGWSGWTTVLSGADSPHWNSSGEPPWAQVGQCYRASGGCNGIGEAWTYFQFNTGFLGGTRILSATLDTVVVHSPNCATPSHQLYIAGGQINGATKWSNRPGGGLLETRAVPGVWTACSAWQPIGFDTHGSIHINDGGGVSTYFLKAADSNDQIAWRKYDPGLTRLRVNFNRAPNPAYGLATDPPVPTPCRWCANVPYVGGSSIRLIGRLSDNDPGELLRPEWDIYTNGAREDRDPDVWLASGSAHDTTLDLRDKDGKTIDWYLRPWDHYDAGDWGHGPGAPFIVDRTAPNREDQKPQVTGRVYQADGRWHGGVDVADTFTFTAKDAPGVTPDIDHFYYGFDDPPSIRVDADRLGGSATATLTPPGDGPRDLYVQSADRADNRSKTTVYHFYVRAGNGPLALWPLEGSTADTALLGDRDARLSGAATYSTGAVGSAIRLDGLGAHLEAPNAVRTDASFSVSAWAYLDSTGYARAVVSQDGAAGSNFGGFVLWYRPEDGGKWVFGMPNAAGTYAGTDMARSAAPAIARAWTHLSGVYDAGQGQLRLYVNGELAGTAPRTVTPWNAAGGIRIGQVWWSGGPVDHWPGGIDQVAVYDRPLDPAEVAAAVSGDNVQLGFWRFDELPTDGSSARNAVPGGDMAVLQNGAVFTGAGGGAVNGGLRLNAEAGQDDYAATAGPVVRTDQSFSVTAWLNPTSAPSSGNARTALSQEGGLNSGFMLGYRSKATGGGVWELFMPSADSGPGRPGDEVLQSGVPARLGDWSHVAAVYDAPQHKIRLYVDGVLAGSATRTLGFDAAGPFTFGRGKWEGVQTNPWVGGIDEVRAYNRVLSAAELQAIVSRDNVTLGAWALDGNGADSSGRGRTATAAAGVDWTAGQASLPDQTDLAARLDGASGYLSAPHSVETNQSFSVTAWAKLERVGGHPTVVSEDGSRVAAFQLQATPDGHWAFTMFAADADGGGAVHDRVVGAAAQTGVWTHLVGVYDAGNRQLRIYVNGALTGSGPHLAAWTYPTGAVTIGRSRWNGAPSDYFPGAIDDVALFNRPLFAGEIATMAGRDLTLVHHWPLDEPTGGDAADAVGDRSGTLLGSAGRVPGRLGNAVHLDGADDAVQSTGIDVRTDQSFTVSAWVYLDRRSDPVSQYTAVSVDGVTSSKFRLGHVADENQNFCLDGVFDDPNKCGAWIFEMPNADDGSPALRAAVSTLPAEITRWTHLTGVYDRAANKVWLYVDGARIGDGTITNPWPSTGRLQIGRSLVGGQRAQHWPGSVDDVRLYTGALDKDRIGTLYRAYPAPSGPVTLPAADAGRWTFDDGTGTGAADSGGRGLPATLRGGAGWIAGRTGSAGWFDGTSGYAETAGQVLDTSGSFSAGAWVYLTGTATGHRTVLGQDGGQSSAFLLQYQAETGRWAVVLPGKPALGSTEPAARDEWTHLAVVYDATLHQLRLYVQGVLSAAQTGVTVPASSGPFSIGRGRVGGANADYFPRGIDDVRAFGKALSDGEVRAVHDDASPAMLDFYRFEDGTARDYGWRHDDAAATGAVSYPEGVFWKARGMQLDGVSASATTPYRAVVMADSFTVSAWVRLARKDKLATAVAQDGTKMSGFVLQYRPQLDRWVFGGPARDADDASLAYAVSARAPAVNEWTHLTGVYDHASHRVRLYVDGQLSGTRENTTLANATGGLSLGRGLFHGAPAEFFPGVLDEVRTEQGIASPAAIQVRAGWAAPPAGQLGRYFDAAGRHYTDSTDKPVRAGYHFEGTLGLAAAAGPNTQMLYACRAGEDGFTSPQADCEGQTRLGEIGLVYTRQPANLPTQPLYRCVFAAGHMDSRHADCEGTTVEMLLGYTVAYAPLARYYSSYGTDHWTSVHGTAPGYLLENTLGWLSRTALPGTQPLQSCLDGTDEFASLDTACEGRTVVTTAGYVYTAAPAGLDTVPLYRCLVNGQRFLSRSTTCEGYTVDRLLGYIPTAPPVTVATFP
jgi:hypothetical protein